MYQRQLTFGEAVSKTLTQNYCKFSGRASRSEFWWWQLFTGIIGVAASLISYSVLGNDNLSYIINILFFLPSLGLQVRRLHDISKSGWLVLLHFVICIGTIILIVFYVKESDMFPNEYGDVPYTDNNDTNNQFTPNNVPPQNNNQW